MTATEEVVELRRLEQEDWPKRAELAALQTELAGLVDELEQEAKSPEGPGQVPAGPEQHELQRGRSIEM